MKQYSSGDLADKAIKGLEPYSGEWGDKQLMHLLRRTMFGFTMEDLTFFKGRPLSECLDILLTKSPDPNPPLNYYYFDEDHSYDDPDVAKGRTWINAPYESDLYDGLRRKFLKGWWAVQMFKQNRSVTEKMILFWHNFLATEMEKVKDSRFSYRHLVLLRKYALGNYKNLIHDITIDPQMLVYLDGHTNVKNAPNENYGRELQELFTVGKELDPHYTEEDVKTAARILTGWKVKGWKGSGEVGSYFDPADHDTGRKVFSSFYNNTVIPGKSGPDGAKEIDLLVDMLFRHKETARYMGRKLYRWFVNSDITPQVQEAVIDPLAEVLIANKFEMLPVIRTLLNSEHFFDPGKLGCQIKSPIDYAVGTTRQLYVGFPPDDDPFGLNQVWCDLCEGLARVYQNIGDPPIVNGWPAYHEAPLYDKIWLDSYSYPVRSVLSYSMCSTKGIFIRQYWLKMDSLKFISHFENPSDPSKLIADSAHLLYAIPIGPAKINRLKSILDSEGAGDNWTTLWGKFSANTDNEDLTSSVETRLCNFYQTMLDFDEYQLM